MSAKISYVFGGKKSSVIILKNGQALEVRRGEKTHWASGEERNMWSSMEEWLTTLPPQWDSVEAWISAGKRQAGYGVGLPLSPGLAYFMGQEKATRLEIEYALDSYTAHHGLERRQWCDGSYLVEVDSFLATLSGLRPEMTHTRRELMVALLEKNEASAPTLSVEEAVAPSAIKEEEVALAVSEEVAVAPVALAAVAETAVVLPNVVDAVVVEEEEAIVYPPPEELGGTDLSYLMMVMKSGNSVDYKQARLTEFVTVCMRPEYASFWRTSMHPRHNLRAIIKTSRVFGTCPVAEAFLARYPA